MSDNYPENIRDYDNEPGSPFADDSRNEFIENLMYELCSDISANHEMLGESIDNSRKDLHDKFNMSLVDLMNAIYKSDYLLSETDRAARDVVVNLINIIEQFALELATKEANSRDRDEQ